MRLKPKQRQSQILDMVSAHGHISVEVLALNFNVSVETIRRDLGYLANCGVLQKIHGGAKSLPLNTESSFAERMSDSVSAKEVIASKLAKMIEPGKTVFLDTGSTTLICAKALVAIKDLTVITNSLRIAQVLGKSQSGITVHLLGGHYDDDNDETTGPLTIEQIGHYQADIAVLCAAAVDADSGVTDANFEEAQVAMAMINCANRIVIVADSTKLDSKAAYRVCRLNRMDALVCEVAPQAKLSNALAHIGIELH